jgi:hypothetical protein
MQRLYSGLSFLMGFVVYKAESSASASVVHRDEGGSNDAERLEKVLELFLGDLGVQVLDVQVRELSLHFIELGLPLLARDMVTHVDLLVIKEHAVDSLDGAFGSLGSLIVDETVAFGTAMLVGGNLAGEDVAERGKSIVERLVVNGLIKVLDENVALAGLAESRIALRPHDPACAVFYQRIIELLQRTLAIRSVEVVDVSIAQGATSDGITTDTDAGYGSDHIEDFEQHSF